MPQIPNRTKREILGGSIDLANDALRLALFDTSIDFAFDPDTHEFVADVLDGTVAAEPSDGSYSRQDLTGTSLSIDSTNETAVFDADDVTISSLDTANQIQGVIVYKEVTDDTDSPLLFVIDDVDDDGLPADTNGTDFNIEWSADGILIGSEA